jgi:hypothetical protein
MATVAEALFGPVGRTNWSEQTRFLASADGTAYIGRLEECRLRQFAAWKRRSEERAASPATREFEEPGDDPGYRSPR